MALDEHLHAPLAEALFEQNTEAILLVEGTSLEILNVNPSAVALLGYSRDQIIRKPLSLLTYPGQERPLQRFIGEAIRLARPRSLSTRLLNANGNPIPCELRLRLLEIEGTPLLLLSLRDLSERIRAMEDIELRNVAIANVTSGVTIADARQPDLPLIYVNQGFQQITGYSAREAVGRSCRFLQGADRSQPDLERLRLALREGSPCVVTIRNYKKTGELFYNELHISPVRNEDGELTHFVGIQLDVTEQVNARESLQRSEARYRQALEREQELNEMRARFISMVSHEFRTPMTAIQASAGLLHRFSERLPPDKLKRHHENISVSLKRMNRLLDDVLFFSRSEANRIEVSLQPVLPEAYFTSVMESIQPIFPGRQIRFESTLPSERPYPLDTHLLDHIFQNLLTNALKYSASDTTVLCRAREDHSDLLFEITDHGIGIPQADQERLFEAFHRAGNVGARQGTGLGLTIALKAIELLGGDLSFSSEENVGSTFIVRLPTQNTTPHHHDNNSDS
jgi:PAS domain S-box-containing protein